MYKIKFPESPNVGDTYTAFNGVVYTYDGIKWTLPSSETETLLDPAGQNGNFIMWDGEDMIWEEPLLKSVLANVYPPDGATDDGLPYDVLPTFIAQTPNASKASQWQISDNTQFDPLVHDTGLVLFEPEYLIYNEVDVTVCDDTSVVGGDIQFSDGVLQPGDQWLYWRVRFQLVLDSTWTEWTQYHSIYYRPFEATGGTITTSNGYRIHTFYSSGTFNVVSAGNRCVELYVIGGGGSGGNRAGGGGGAGGRYKSITRMPKGSYSVIIGSGGSGNNGTYGAGDNGNSSFFDIHEGLGGGCGGGNMKAGGFGQYPCDGGCGGGTGTQSRGISSGGTGLQGFDGGHEIDYDDHGGGGGGLGQKGKDGYSSGPGDGGDGIQINGVYYGGGGGAGKAPWRSGGYAYGGLGGGGDGSKSDTNHGTPGQANTGGGGGGTSGKSSGNPSGGSGIVIVMYKIQ